MLLFTFLSSSKLFFFFVVQDPLVILSSHNVCFKNMLDLKCYHKTPCFGEFWFNSAYKFILELVHRVKRRADPDPMKNTCKLLVVADHRFYRYMGRGEESTTTNYLIELIDRVDDIYRNTSWDNAGFKGYGIQIEQVFINRYGLYYSLKLCNVNICDLYPKPKNLSLTIIINKFSQMPVIFLLMNCAVFLMLISSRLWSFLSLVSL